MGMRTTFIRGAGVVAAAALALPTAAGGHSGFLGSGGRAVAPAAPPAAAPGCPTAVDPATFPSEADVLRANQRLDAFGLRPTGSPAQAAFVRSIERRMQRLEAIEMRSIPYEIPGWYERGSALRAGRETLPTAGAVPYSKPATGRGRLVYIPHGESLADHDIAGKIVVRDAVPGSIPNAAFTALMWWAWDPGATFVPDETGNYERDFVSYMERVDDLHAAGDGRAAGVVFVHGFPRKLVDHQYAPYEGEHWRVPAVQVGVDEGERLKALAAQGANGRVQVRADKRKAHTRTLIARLPGMSDDRIVIESHTDGMNAIWDNGPLGIMELAEHFASLPRECRPRTIEFVFTTAHLHQRLDPSERDGGAEDYAEQLDREYDEGKVALVMAMEHMGAREFAAVPRPDGLPGRTLEPTGKTEPTGIFVGESPALIARLAEAVTRHDLRRTLALRGADLPGVHFPPHHSFGGEGTPYNHHLLPTIALVTGPWSLYNPSFGAEAIDPELMRRQTIVYADLVHLVADLPREAIGGGFLAQREARGLLCSADPAGFGLASCG